MPPNINELLSTFLEYRKTQHEKFGQIHVQIADLDESHEKMEDRLHKLEDFVITLKSNWRLMTTLVWVAGAVIGSFLTAFGGEIVKALFGSK